MLDALEEGKKHQIWVSLRQGLRSDWEGAL